MNIASKSVLRGWRNSGYLTCFMPTGKFRLFWHGGSPCTARHLTSEGLSRENGQLSFLQIYQGKKPISVEDLEMKYFQLSAQI